MTYFSKMALRQAKIWVEAFLACNWAILMADRCFSALFVESGFFFNLLILSLTVYLLTRDIEYFLRLFFAFFFESFNEAEGLEQSSCLYMACGIARQSSKNGRSRLDV